MKLVLDRIGQAVQALESHSRAVAKADPGSWRLITLSAIIFLILPRIILTPVTAFGPDEGIYALVARDLLNGKLPFDGAFDHKPAAIYYIFAAFQAVFSDAVLSMRFLGTLVTLGTGLLLADIAPRAFLADARIQAAIMAAFGAWSLANDGTSTGSELI